MLITDIKCKLETEDKLSALGLCIPCNLYLTLEAQLGSESYLS